MLNQSLRPLVNVQVRSVSSKYPRPTPRHFKRRLFEAALKPELPPTVNMCIPPGLIKREHTGKSKEYSDVELALSNLVRDWMVREEFRVMAVCQFLPVPGRTLWFAKNQLRSKNIEFRSYGNKILKKIFDKTPMSSLNTVLVGNNAILLAKDISAIKSILQETDKLNWIEPLVMMADGRIVDMVDARELAKLSSLEDLRAHTVQLLGQQVAQVTISLDTVTRHLPSLLDSHISTNQEAKK
ncbi:Large ribosomal subunit protein uL10m [Caenorhabditis elegans]|uniref:Large ribosomal subunit protein uL10m n=1 Tax=Caenorhabditis elegans TaxID=6239 RepID=Q21083_CAEEL|nr:Large ribosomal subunit protein uL10m [Caenorhabditis elegans]CAA88857.1 Large ribosomal subunit protein uL10m [Caenorhabditis elegans]|eukprot:NP_495747.1 Mitochondrial Ribosomal Protein, Large [Caenorhabditis elegans]